MADFDIFAPQISQVSYSMAGKTMLLYGTNSTGKTYQATHFPKPVVLAFESGLNGLSGVPYFTMNKWSQFVKFVKQLTNEKNIDRLKEMYQTIILDEASIMGKQCQQFVCEKYGVERVKDGNDGFGLWQEYSDEFQKQLNLVTSAGYTVVFIAHEGTRKFKDENGVEYSKIYPEGDKRIIDPICNLVDIIAYAAINNPDENGMEVKSSLFLKNTRKYHARSRFDYMVPYLPVFTAQNLQDAIRDAVKAQEEAEGFAAVNYEQQQEAAKPASMTYEQLFEAIKSIAIKMNEDGNVGRYKEIVETHLGKGRGVQETTPAQIQMLELIYADLKDIVEE